MEVILDANIATFQGHGGTPTGGVCAKIADAAGVVSAYVSCSAADKDGDVAFTAVIQAHGSSSAKVNAGIKKHMGTTADASAHLSLAATARSAAFDAVVKSVPTTSTDPYLDPLAAAGAAAAALTGSSSGLAPGVIAGAVVGGVAGLALIAVLIYFMACKKKPPTGKDLPA